MKPLASQIVWQTGNNTQTNTQENTMSNTGYDFEYNVNLSEEGNFARWYQLNCAERDAYNEPILNLTEARTIFSGIVKPVTS
jgi:hypothetical protein